MTNILHHLWRDLSASEWVLIALPTLLFLRVILSYRWERIGRRAIAPLSAASSHSSNSYTTIETEVEPGEEEAAPEDARENAGLRLVLLEWTNCALFSLALVFLVIRPFIGQLYFIPSASMEETLQIGDRIAVSKLAYHFGSPQRGDVVVFEPPSRATSKTQDDWIKRVIGLPGDHIAVRNNHLYLNGKVQSEPYITLLDRGSDQPGIPHISTGQYDYTFPEPPIENVPQGKAAYMRSGELGSGTQVCPTIDKTPAPGGDYLFFMQRTPQQDWEIVVPQGKLFVMGDNRNNSDDSHFWGCLDQDHVLGKALCVYWPFNHLKPLYRK